MSEPSFEDGPAPVFTPPRPVCKRKHRWQVVEQRREPSMMERLIKSGMTSIERFGGELLEDSYFVHYRCGDCGLEDVRRV